MRRFSFGPFTLDPARRLLTRNGKPIALTPKAFDTLLVLVEERDTALTKDTLVSRVWPDVVVEESNLAQTIFTLRRALDDDPARPAFIATIPRHGYRFVADVVEYGDQQPNIGTPIAGLRWWTTAAVLTAVVIAATAATFVRNGCGDADGRGNLKGPGTVPHSGRLAPALTNLVRCQRDRLRDRPARRADARQAG